MIRFVGAEYLIATMLLEKAKDGKREITMDELGKYGIYVQRESVINKLDTVFLVSKPQIITAIYDCSDYFEFELDSNEQITGITINATKGLDDLEFRFMGRLPREILDFLLKKAKEFDEVA